MMHKIRDWNAVYDNAPNIPNGGAWPAVWVEPAAKFRRHHRATGRAKLDLRYGQNPRQLLDLFMPEGMAKGLVVFVHGGFWMALDRSYWSHYAKGPLAHGYAVAIVQYTLCPEAQISQITQEIGQAITFLGDHVEGEIRLVGHSAGGHLVTRMISDTSPLSKSLRERIAAVLSISGLHDLRPMRQIWRQNSLRLTETEAISESPALLSPIKNATLICWVGAMETSEFLRQSALLANIWQGLGAATDMIVEPDRHHFNVPDSLADPDHPMIAALLR